MICPRCNYEDETGKVDKMSTLLQQEVSRLKTELQETKEKLEREAKGRQKLVHTASNWKNMFFTLFCAVEDVDKMSTLLQQEVSRLKTELQETKEKAEDVLKNTSCELGAEEPHCYNGKSDFDEVEKPYHYNVCGEIGADGRSKYEPVKVIRSWGHEEGFCVGNAVKYLLRAPYKGSEKSDLKKALWYLERVCGGIKKGEDCNSSEVVEAWRLPDGLQDVLMYISVRNYEQAAYHLVLYLSAKKMADEIAEIEDEKFLSEAQKYVWRAKNGKES